MVRGGAGPVKAGGSGLARDRAIGYSFFTWRSAVRPEAGVAKLVDARDSKTIRPIPATDCRSWVSVGICIAVMVTSWCRFPLVFAGPRWGVDTGWTLRNGATAGRDCNIAIQPEAAPDKDFLHISLDEVATVP